MANLSDAGVDIVVTNVGDELLAYIEATNKDTIDYAIVYDGYDTHVNDNGDLVISGNSSGRWAYSNNLEGYFDPEKVKQWLGVDNDYEWLQDEEKKKQYKEDSQLQYDAYCKLIEAIKTKDGRVEINYTDCDPAMDWMSTGGAVLEVEDGEVMYLHSDESETLDITKYADMNGMDIEEAFENVHGEEPAAEWVKYVKQCEDKGVTPKDPQEWYDNDFEWED